MTTERERSNKSKTNTDQSLVLYTARAAAGFPVPGDDQVDIALNIHELLVKHPESTFFVRVSGESMSGAGIFDQDILVVDRSLEPVNGAIVVAVVDGGLVVKRLKISGAKKQLVSAHEDYAPIEVGESAECYVWGVVTGSVRQLV